MESHMRSPSTLAVGLLLVSAHHAHAQSFNIDFDVIAFIPGYDAPGSSYPAAAGQPGHWNALAGIPRTGRSLRDLNDQPTSVILTPGGTARVTGDHDPRTSGDRARLMDDCLDFSISTSLNLIFTGLQEGRYRIYVYGICPASEPEFIAAVSVPRAIEGTQLCGGIMPAEGFTLGLTHVVHRIDIVAQRDMHVIVGRSRENEPACINGMQIVRLGPPCFGDIDQSGDASVADIFEFLNLWFALDPRADVDDRHGVDTPDLFAFLNSWFSGCA